DLEHPQHVEEALGPAEVGDECRSADSGRGDRRHPARDPQSRPIADLRAETQQGRTSGEAAEEQVGSDLITPGRGLDDGSAVVGRQLPVLAHRHLTVALGAAVLPPAAPTTTAATSSGARAATAAGRTGSAASAALLTSAFGLGRAVGIVF